jgi:hypothetical protein
VRTAWIVGVAHAEHLRKEVPGWDAGSADAHERVEAECGRVFEDDDLLAGGSKRADRAR